MERMIILLMILVGLYLLMRFFNNSRSIKTRQSSRHLASNRDQVSDASRTNLLSTPGNNLLANNNKVWKNRCQQEAQIRAGGNVVGSRSAQNFTEEPAYDGYSRRDRHQLSPAAHIEEEKHIDNLRP